MDFNGKRVLITGGGSGVGADMARAFAARGAEVWIGGRRRERLVETASLHDNINFQELDVVDPTSVAAFFNAAGSVDIVIANAGIVDSVPLAKLSDQGWADMISINLTGVFNTYRAAVQTMTGGWGRIIAVSSIAGVKGLAYAAHYSAAKHGVVGLTRSLALEVAKSGVTVNAICPGYLDTEMTETAVAGISDKSGRSPDEALAAITAGNPMRRLIRKEEVTDAALWLAGDGASSVNGQAITLSGGDP